MNEAADTQHRVDKMGAVFSSVCALHCLASVALPGLGLVLSIGSGVLLAATHLFSIRHTRKGRHVP